MNLNPSSSRSKLALPLGIRGTKWPWSCSKRRRHRENDTNCYQPAVQIAAHVAFTIRTTMILASPNSSMTGFVIHRTRITLRP
jgi:hypothetical protein